MKRQKGVMLGLLAYKVEPLGRVDHPDVLNRHVRGLEHRERDGAREAARDPPFALMVALASQASPSA